VPVWTDPIDPTEAPPGHAPYIGDGLLAINDFFVGSRLGNAVYRKDSIWTTHTVSLPNGLDAVRWYQYVPSTGQMTMGVISDPARSYYLPSLAVSINGNLGISMGGCSATEYPGVWFTGRAVTQPPGYTDPPTLIHAGEDYYYLSIGGNRWGDFSSTCSDYGTDDFWSSQEYAEPWNSAWQSYVFGTWIGHVAQ
jgi:hypothetical protein